MRSAGRLALGLALATQACAPVTTETPPATRAEPGGSFSVHKGQPGLVVAAPHGTTDIATDAIGRDLARLTGWSALLVTGFSSGGGSGRRLSVNRPTEGVQGQPPSTERVTEQAREVFEAYRRHLDAASQGPLRLYVEVHGNVRAESAARIEIATVGVSRETAWRLKTLLELVRDAALQGRAEVPRLEVLVEPLDALFYAASATKHDGVLAQVPRALHIELPRSARSAHREVYTGILAKFLGQAIPVLLPDGR
jgi:hypothetical protein